jgi:hypothetical protein
LKNNRQKIKMSIIRTKAFTTIATTTVASTGNNATKKKYHLISSRAPQYVPVEFLPTIFKGHWRTPKISLRLQAELRKSAMLNNKIIPGGKLQNGEWDPAWDLYRRSYQMPKALKGAKFDRNLQARVAAIKKNMDEMPKRIQEYQEKRDARGKIPFVENFLRKNKLISSENKEKGVGKNT